MATETKKDQGKATSSHDLTAEQVAYGGVYLADYDPDDTVTVGDVTVPKVAYAAAGKTTGDRDVPDGERAMNAQRIDQSVRAYRSWLDTQPVEVRLAAAASPVIHVAADGD